MKISEISEEFDDGEAYDEVEGSIMEQEMIEEEKSQGDLSSAAGSFVSARFSLSSSSSSSLSSTPSSSCPASPSLTPLDRRVIGRDIELRVSFRWLPFTYEEWYGHPPQTDTRARMTEKGSSSSSEPVVHHQPGQTRAFSPRHVQNAKINPPRDLKKMKIAVRIFRTDGHHELPNDGMGWNPLKLLLKRRRLAGAGNVTNVKYLATRKALKAAITIPGVLTVKLNGDIIIIEGTGIDMVHAVERLRCKTGWAELLDDEHVTGTTLQLSQSAIRH